MPHRLIEGGRRKDRFSALTSEAGPSTQARVKAAYEFTAQPRLALQLLFWEVSESMGNHDSEVMDASSVD